jgi:hypothetical protein
MADARTETLSRAVKARVSITHPGLLPATVARDDDGRQRIRLRRLAAPTLDEVLSEGPLDEEDAIRLVSGVASAVDALRRAGLIARDLSPSRILVPSPSRPMLADTGIPLELVPRTSPSDDANAAFRSPEEIEGSPIDARSNVYSLGMLLLTALDMDGRELPQNVQAVIQRATAREPQERHDGPKDFIVDVAAAFGLRFKVRSGSAKPGSAAPPAPTPNQRSEAKQSGARKRARPAARPKRTRGGAGSAKQKSSAGAAAKSGGANQKKSSSRRTVRPADRARTGRAAPRPRVAETPARERATAERETPAPAQTGSVARSRLPKMPRLPRLDFKLPSMPRPPTVKLPDLASLKGYLRPPALPGTRVRSQPSVGALVVALAIMGCVISGLLLARVAGEDDGGARIQSALLSVQLPKGWDGTKVDREPSIDLSAPVAAAPPGESGTGLVAGRVDDAVALDRRLSLEASRRSEVPLGKLEAWRYSGLEPENGLLAVAYLAPTSDDSVLVICHARRPGATERLNECERIASTITLRGARPAPLASVGEAERAVSEVMEALHRERLDGRRKLARADLAKDQARVARQLEASYRSAAEMLERSPVTDRAAGELADTLRATASAYADLAAAASDGDRSGYSDATRLIVKREAAVERAAAQPLSA